MFGDDVIRDPKDDELDRSGFAKALAHAILTMDVDSPFVFSIEGEWGTGKSTVLEFIKYYFQHRAEIGPKVPLERDPIIVELSPWWFSGSEDLLRQFIGEISLQLRSEKRVKDKLARLPDLLDNLDAALTPSALIIPHGAQAKILVKAAVRLIRWCARTKDVASVRKEIERTLRDQTDRIVVILDDLDRLQPQELLQVFQVVKAIANLPKLIWVLSFHREAVTKGLTEARVHDPDQYIEKIVQSVWTLPAPDRLGVSKLTGKVIDQLLAETPPELWQNDRWISLYFDGLRDLIRTPRDVKRLANALRPCYPPVKSEVNLVDFVGFHALRVLVPSAYAFVVVNRGWLTNSELHFFRDEDEERHDQNRRIDAMLGSLPIWQRSPVAKMLEAMFPMFDRRAKRSGLSGGSWARWQRECRICSADRFDFYDRLSIPAGAISIAELNRLLKPTSVAGFRLDLRNLHEEQAYDGETKLKKFLEYANGSVSGTLGPTEIQALLTHLFHVADEFISKLEPPSLPFCSCEWQFARLVDAIIGLLPKGEERLSAIARAWIDAPAISLMIQCYSLWNERLTNYEGGNLATTTYFSRQELTALSGDLLHRIGSAAAEGVLARTPLLHLVLGYWDGQRGGAGSYFAFRVSSDEQGFADLAVGALCPRPPLATKAIYRSEAQLLQQWTKASREELIERCETILATRPGWLSEIQETALRAFVTEVRTPRDQWGFPIGSA
jgi:predicted KAP-like P-loop ATPase